MTKREKSFMAQARARFIQERVCGYRGTDGVYRKPIAKSTAERKWSAHRHRFVEAMKDPEVRRKLQLD